MLTLRSCKWPHAYIASQRAEGWTAAGADYDDPAYSGGNMERPALKRLMADIEAGQIEVVVIYKIDRLTRSLADFSKMVEVFERPGCIVNLSSTHGLIGFAQRSAYGISKAGISHMTRMLAIEWADHRIRVNAVAPGTVATPSRVAYFSADTGGFKAMIDRVPLARLCEMDEVAAMVSYLASPAAAYITGQTMVLDGGLTSY